MAPHYIKDVIEALGLVVWTALAGKSLVKQYPTWKKMFEWPEPDRWPKMVRHTEINYCEECDPTPQPHDGEIMFCPKCDRPMAHHKHSYTRYVDENRTKTETEETKDWFCGVCQEMWPDVVARKFQTNWHREQNRQAYARGQAAVQAAANAGIYQAGAGWSSYRVNGGPTFFDPQLLQNVYQGPQAIRHGVNKQFFEYRPGVQTWGDKPVEDDTWEGEK